MKLLGLLAIGKILMMLYDNTEVFKRFAVYKKGKICFIADEIPQWFDKYIR